MARRKESAAMRAGRRIRELRTGRGWSIYDLAARSGIPATTVARVERGTATPIERYEVFAGVLGVPVATFFVAADGAPRGPVTR